MSKHQLKPFTIYCENDIRINKMNKCLLPGSFTTTSLDALRCKVEKDDPDNRYALSNELEIKWAFYIEPMPNDILKRGCAESKFSKKGGGREVYFEKGTSNSAFIAQTKW